MVKPDLNRGSIIAAGEALEELGFNIVQTAGFFFRRLYKGVQPMFQYVVVAEAEYTHKDKKARLQGSFSAEELRAMANYMEATSE